MFIQCTSTLQTVDSVDPLKSFKILTLRRSLKILKIFKDVQKCQQRLPCLRSGEIFCRRLRARPGHGGLFCGRPWPGDQHGLQKKESAEVHQGGIEICWNQVLSGFNSVAPVAMVFFNRSLKGCLLCGMCASAPALLHS